MRQIPALTALCLLTALLLGACSPAPESDSGKRRSSAHLVETQVAREQDVSAVYSRTGSLRARRSVRILAQEEGRIVELPFLEGDRVERGQTLARLDDILLRAEFEREVATRELAELNLQRVAQLSEKNLASQDEFARAQTALKVAQAEEALLRERLKRTLMKAPFAGIITERLAEAGDAVARYSHILTLSDPTSLVTEVELSELLIANLNHGDEVAVRIDALGPHSHSGRLVRIYPDIDPGTHQGRVEIELSPVPKGARAGQLCRVTFTTAPLPRLMVPLVALQRDSRGEYLYTIDNENRAHRAQVRSGLRVNEDIEIIEGLEPGQTVVTRGLLGLREELDVEIVSGNDKGS